MGIIKPIAKLFLLNVFLLLTQLAHGAVAPNDPEREKIFQLRENDMFLGNKEASVVILNYSSVTCPYCADFHHDVFAKIKEGYIDNGDVFYIYRPFPVDEAGLYVGLFLAEKGIDLEKKFSLVESLYNSQGYWMLSGDHEGAINKMARLVGIDEDFISAISTGSKDYKSFAEEIKRDAELLPIVGMPTIFINGKIFHHTAKPNKLFQLIDKLIAKNYPK